MYLLPICIYVYGMNYMYVCVHMCMYICIIGTNDSGSTAAVD